MFGTIAVPLSAPAQTSVVVDDPVGDTKHRAPAFQDMVRAEIIAFEEESENFFLLRMEMADTIPENPPLPPPGASEIWWAWVLDLDPTTTPQGYPGPPGVGIFHWAGEFMVYVAWNGTKFTGTAIDRRPLLTGGEAIPTAVPFEFSEDRKIVEVVLASELIGDPSSFGWRVVTRDWSSSPGTEGFHQIDENGQFGFIPFP